MSGRDDHHVEMPTPALDENLVEAFLSGRPTGAEELGPLSAFAEDLRVTVDRPVPVPNEALATLLADGIPAPTGAAAVSSSMRTAGAADSRNRRKLVSVSQLLAALAAKLAGLGMASKAALGLGVAAASVSTAGVAGVLPDPAQQAVASVISATTPFELPDSGDAGTDGSGVDDTDGVTDDADVPDADRAENHGACVSAIAKNAPKGPNGEHGKAVSTAARSDCGKDASTSSTTSSSSSTSTSTTSTTLDDASIEDNRGRGGPGSNGGGGNSGPGNSGNGNGNPGNGNSGNGNSGPGNSGSGGGQGPGRSGKAG